METVPFDCARAGSSHHCQLYRFRSPTSRLSCQGPPPTLTSTRAIGAAPDHATPRIVKSPPASTCSERGPTITPRTPCTAPRPFPPPPPPSPSPTAPALRKHPLTTH